MSEQPTCQIDGCNRLATKGKTCLTHWKPAQSQEDLIAEHVRKVVDACPPLTPAQRDKLALLLRPRT